MISNSIVMEMIADCVQWYYENYDHKQAIEEMKLKFDPDGLFGNDNYVSHEVKQNHIIWRKGKLRSLKFDPDGIIQTLFVGRNHRYAKSFIPQHVGVTLKPILNVNLDKFNLIKAGFAIDEKTLNL